MITELLYDWSRELNIDNIVIGFVCVSFTDKLIGSVLYGKVAGDLESTQRRRQLRTVKKVSQFVVFVISVQYFQYAAGYKTQFIICNQWQNPFTNFETQLLHGPLSIAIIFKQTTNNL